MKAVLLEYSGLCHLVGRNNIKHGNHLISKDKIIQRVVGKLELGLKFNISISKLNIV